MQDEDDGDDANKGLHTSVSPTGFIELVREVGCVREGPVVLPHHNCLHVPKVVPYLVS